MSICFSYCMHNILYYNMHNILYYNMHLMTANTSESSPTKTCSAASAFDLRGWIEKAKAIGQLREAEDVSLRFELGAITELNAKRRGPAILFSKFAGYPEGFRVVTGTMFGPALIASRLSCR